MFANKSRLDHFVEIQVDNPFLELVFQPPTVERFALRKSFKGHLNSVSAVAFHPRKVGSPEISILKLLPAGMRA